MHYTQNQGTANVLPILMGGSSGGVGGTGPGTSWASSNGSTAEYTHGFLDRYRLSRLYRSAKAVIPWTGSLGPAGNATRVVVNVAIQDAPDSTGGTGGWADVVGAIPGSTGTRQQVIMGSVVTSSAGWSVGTAHADFNLAPARRYVRLSWNLDLLAATSSGQSVLFQVPTLLLAGGEALPVDQNFRACST